MKITLQMTTKLKFFPLLTILLLNFFIMINGTILDQDDQEKKMLMSFKKSLLNPKMLSKWNHDTHCAWEGVTCKNNRVTSLVLSTRSLNGSLPNSLFQLTNLITLDLSENHFTGHLSAEIINLKNLQFLNLRQNNLSGQLPSQLGELTQLKTLLLGVNNFSGQIPPEFGKLKKLVNLDLSFNPLKCSIPKALGQLQNLTIINLIYSQLNGSIPSELGNCRNLETLDLSFNSLSGSLPQELSNLPLLSFSAEHNQLSGDLPKWVGKWVEINTLLLGENMFTGRVPKEIGNLTLLNSLQLSNNLLTGFVPREICNAVSLSQLNLEVNMLSGSIGDTFMGCRNLTRLVLYENQIVGVIPGYLFELPLIILDLDSNLLNGSIPVKLWNSSSLMEFSAAYNMLEGGLVEEIESLVTLERLILSNNSLSGVIPKAIGMLSSLSVLDLNSNQFSGLIPAEIGNLASLTTLDLGGNRLNGSIPVKVTRLSKLQCLVLSHNDLSGSIPYSKNSSYFREVSIPDSSFVQHHGLYDLSNNRLTGKIPDELGDCLVVVDLFLNGNILSGELPKSLAKLTNLTTLDLSRNLLSGGIPAEFGRSLKLQGLFLENNNLTGRIPVELGQLQSLDSLNLTGNRLSGSIPSAFGNLTGLSHLDLSCNLLDGELPSTLSSMVKLVGLFLQQNKLSGRLDDLFVGSGRIVIMNLSNNLFSDMLPRNLDYMSCLTTLDLHGNALTGEIPWGIGNLKLLEFLDFSNNKISGRIPDSLCGVLSLNYMNLAGNELEGPVPKNGICGNTSRIMLSNNKALCGEVIGLQCPGTSSGRGSKFFISNWLLALIVVGALLVTASITFVAIKCVQRIKKRPDCEDPGADNRRSSADQNNDLLGSSRGKERLSIDVAMIEQQPLVNLTYSDICIATDNFSDSKTIGDGGFGTVYKAQLNGQTVAIKRLKPSISHGQREFDAEIETLGKVTHEYLVSLIGYCSGGEEKLLVYEYMENNSLDYWLRTEGIGVLTWDKRFKIALGSARGLAFLHHESTPHIIHRDIKTANILLNKDFEPKIADFGLVRLISEYDTHVSTLLAGTCGYIPPEYSQRMQSSTKGDVYSFGVILLELVTGKKPTGEFKEGGNLAEWVCLMIKKGQAVDVLDPAIVDISPKKAMLQMVKIAATCVSDKPANRPSMLNLVKSLEKIKHEL